MKRRHYLILFILLFGCALYGIIHAVVSNPPQVGPVAPTNGYPETPAPTNPNAQ